ncbi:hypothetical protein [Cellulomonas alba]|uniref:Uncharacterized protein n=1 Tax=Cellulomonas alba TaxID=3053467 RepID=A0ABT7SED5_9CELL|nr:hypothetical protein [Cellulomonas alba]MDM7854544.1 hypothetical protein [Cellulomonas alba]
MSHDTELVLHVSPGTDEWGTADDDRWRADLAELHRLLARELPDETQEPTQADGTRGIELAQVLVDLGSAGVITAAVEVVKAWIAARPGRRSVKATVTEHGAVVREVLVESDGLGAAELGQVAAAFGPQAGQAGQADRSPGA